MVTQSSPTTFPGFSHVHLLEEPANSQAFRGKSLLTVEDAFALARAEKVLDRVEVRWAMGRTVPTDVIRTTIAAPVIVAERVVDILRSRNFSGWESYAVALFGKYGASIPGYRGLAVHGRCGPIENDRSMKFDKSMPGGVFDEVRQAFQDARVRSVSFTSLEEIERSSVEMS